MPQDDARTYAIVSSRLWARRDDLARLFDARMVRWPAASGTISGFIGAAGGRSSAVAAFLARRQGKQAFAVGEGFLRGFAPEWSEPLHAYVIDPLAGEEGGRFRRLDQILASPVVDATALERARKLMAQLRDERLSIYNNAPFLSREQAGLPCARPFILLLDQAAPRYRVSDLKLRFREMLSHAAESAAGRALVLCHDRASSGPGLLADVAAEMGVSLLSPPAINPWCLIEEADCVYTVSSPLGVSALIAGRALHCFGPADYAGRGLSVDHGGALVARAPMSLAQFFHAGFIDHTLYLDLHTRQPCSMERAVEQAVTVRNQRFRLERPVVTAGLSYWKRKALAPFLKGARGEITHYRTLKGASRAALHMDGIVAVWGSDRPLPEEGHAIRLEDGFIRSRGLGVNFTAPASIAVDGRTIYYDARAQSGLEALLSDVAFDEALLSRARDLIRMLVERGVSKYNLGTSADLPVVSPERLKILVPGQVEKDASIRFGSPVVRSNAALVRAVRTLFPDAFIAYKEHPDVTSGMRGGGNIPDAADLIVRSGDILQWIAWADRLETMTSLAGFEALLRGKPVGVHGVPFYAGWGLTDNRMAISRRTRKLDLERLVAASLILYPFYVHPLSRLPCTPEDLIEGISAAPVRKPEGVLLGFYWRLVQEITRLQVRLRDRQLD